MSAFVVSHDHINAMLTFAKDKRMGDRLSYFIDRSKTSDWNTIGRVLLAENERSVCHRYVDAVPGDAPGVIGQEAVNYSFQPYAPFATMPFTRKLVWVIKQCDCFDYQACETDDYDESIAHRIIAEIRAKAIRCLPDYDAAPWGI